MSSKIYISQYELYHYASPYYDPVKAHEYYEQHKKLKGRTAGRTLTDTGKEAKLYVSDQIRTAKKTVSEQSKAAREQAKTDRDNTHAANKAAHVAEMDKVNNEMLSMSKEELRKAGPMYRKKIASLKKANSEAKAKAQKEYSDKIKSIREANKAKQKELSDTLKSESEKLLLDPETSKATGKKKKSGGGGAPTSKEALERIRRNAEKMKKNKEEKSK